MIFAPVNQCYIVGGNKSTIGIPSLNGLKYLTHTVAILSAGKVIIIIKIIKPHKWMQQTGSKRV